MIPVWSSENKEDLWGGSHLTEDINTLKFLKEISSHLISDYDKLCLKYQKHLHNAATHFFFSRSILALPSAERFFENLPSTLLFKPSLSSSFPNPFLLPSIMDLFNHVPTHHLIHASPSPSASSFSGVQVEWLWLWLPSATFHSFQLITSLIVQHQKNKRTNKKNSGHIH